MTNLSQSADGRDSHFLIQNRYRYYTNVGSNARVAKDSVENLDKNTFQRVLKEKFDMVYDTTDFPLPEFDDEDINTKV